jgi:hypothetical protein
VLTTPRKADLQSAGKALAASTAPSSRITPSSAESVAQPIETSDAPNNRKRPVVDDTVSDSQNSSISTTRADTTRISSPQLGGEHGTGRHSLNKEKRRLDSGIDEGGAREGSTQSPEKKAEMAGRMEVKVKKENEDMEEQETPGAASSRSKFSGMPCA